MLRRLAFERMEDVAKDFVPKVADGSIQADWILSAIKACQGRMRKDMTKFRQLVILFPGTWLVARTAAKDYHDAFSSIVSNQQFTQRQVNCC